MEKIRNIVIEGRHHKPVVADVLYKKTARPKPIIILSHGFKGFKDWGAYNLVAKWFAERKFVIVKFNFSHNGTTPESPDEFTDLEAFGNNNFEIELDDLGKVIDWVIQTPVIPEEEKNTDEIYLIGHSRGGGISILKAAEDNRVKKLATWASVNNFGGPWTPEKVKAWKENGVMWVENLRTGQRMPLYYQLYENWVANKDRLDIRAAVDDMEIPFLVIHGTEDEAVPFEQGIDMKRWNSGIKLDLIPNSNHTFGAKHPWTDLNLPEDLQIVVEHTEAFFRS